MNDACLSKRFDLTGNLLEVARNGAQFRCVDLSIDAGSPDHCSFQQPIEQQGQSGEDGSFDLFEGIIERGLHDLLHQPSRKTSRLMPRKGAASFYESFGRGISPA